MRVTHYSKAFVIPWNNTFFEFLFCDSWSVILLSHRNIMWTPSESSIHAPFNYSGSVVSQKSLCEVGRYSLDWTSTLADS